MREIRDTYEVIEDEVYGAYHTVLSNMEHFEVAPRLEDIYEEFFQTVMSNIEEAYAEVFGDGVDIRSDWLRDLGIDMTGIPDILVVCRVLNLFRLGYLYQDTLYNYMPQKLLKEELSFEDGYSETYLSRY